MVASRAAASAMAVQKSLDTEWHLQEVGELKSQKIVYMNVVDFLQAQLEESMLKLDAALSFNSGLLNEMLQLSATAKEEAKALTLDSVHAVLEPKKLRKIQGKSEKIWEVY